MRIELRYFTGTGNSLRIINTCHSVFIGSGHYSSISEISKHDRMLPESDLIGFCFPVYAFGIPRICYRYLKGIVCFKKQQKAFILITAGDLNESGYAIRECERILRRKHCDVVYSAVIQMPVNWTTSPKPPYPPSPAEAKGIIHKGVIQTQKISEDIMGKIEKHHCFNYPERYSRINFFWEYLLFKYVGIHNLWRLFNVYDTCNGCQLCARICPTNSISIIDKKPVWSKSCEQCMRCVNFCPKESIYQMQGGDTKGKNKYHEPDFRPKYASPVS